jgi:ribosome-binding protein aMBF1 (putative translation factor)
MLRHSPRSSSEQREELFFRHVRDIDFDRHFEGHGPPAAPLPAVPDDYDRRLRRLRQRMRFSQADLAARIGAAGKAVVYQWEARKRTPSPVFWQKIEALRVGSRD